MAMQTSRDGKIDRQSTVPFHLKLFYRTGSFRWLEDLHQQSPQNLPPHVQIYTWPTCTLRELSHLLVTALPQVLPDPAVGTRIAYRLVFPDTRDSGRPGPASYISKDLGSVVLGAEGEGVLPSNDEGARIVAGGPMAGELAGEPEKTLQEARFVIGDYVSCAIYPPLPNGSVAPAPSSGSASRGAGAGRATAGFSGGRNDRPGGERENGHSNFRVRGSARSYARENPPSVPSGEWRRGERLPDGPGGGNFGRGRPRARY